MLAYHWQSALELDAGQRRRDDGEVAERARVSLRDAGDRAFGLNSFAVAASLYEDALELSPDDDERSVIAFRRARALFTADDERSARCP